MLKATSEGVILLVKVIPKASFNKITGWENGKLKVRLTAVAEKGKANEALIDLLADVFGLAKSKICLIQGHNNRHKRLCLEGLTVAAAERLLENELSS